MWPERTFGTERFWDNPGGRKEREGQAVSLAENIQKVKVEIAAAAREVGRVPEEITLVAATKTQSDETIRAAIAAGITACG